MTSVATGIKPTDRKHSTNAAGGKQTRLSVLIYLAVTCRYTVVPF